jgi:hypothetical protein
MLTIEWVKTSRKERSNMDKKIILFLASAFVCFVLGMLGCYAAARMYDYYSTKEAAKGDINPSWNCLKPPVKDLIGTWYSGGPMRNETLVFREDGTYKQTIHIGYVYKPNLDYESGWQPWRTEYTDHGLYIYLKGMSLCGYAPDLENCKHATEAKGLWRDFCGNNGGEERTTDNEGILIVMGVPALIQPPRGIQLETMTLDEFPWGYELKEP